MQQLRRWTPTWIRTYDRSWLRPDAIAGITVLAYMVPQVLAYSSIVGAPPIAGLTTAVAALAVYALLGTSRIVSVGPEATVALMAGLVLAPLVAKHPEQAVALMATLTLLVGTWLALGGLVRAGFIAQLLTPPILTGYLAGEAVLMVASQLGHATLADSSGASVPEQLYTFVQHLPQVHPLTVAVTAATVALLVLLPRVSRRIPAPLTVVAVATFGSFAFAGSEHGLQELGNIPRGVPPMTLPVFDTSTMATLLVGSLGIALLAFSDVMLVARAFAAPGEAIDADRELLAIAAVHVASAFGGGYPSSASSSRTAIGRGTGQRTQLSGLVTAAGMIAVVAAAGVLLEHLPQATLAGLVMWAGVRLISIPAFRRLWQFRRAEFAIAVITAAGTAVFGILPGIGIAVALSALQILVALSHPHEAIQGYAVGLAGLHDVDDYPDHVTIPGLLVYRYDGPLVAYNRADFEVQLSKAVLEYNPRWVLLNVEANMLVDYSACETLHAVVTRLQSEGRTVALARLKHDLRLQLEAAGIIELIGDRCYETLPQAIKAYHEANPDIALPPIPAPGEPFDPAGPSSLG